MSYKLEVDLHTHTLASHHAYSTIHDYVREAPKRGIRLFANTDHGPDMEDAPHRWHFVNSLTFPRVADGVGILRGIESNIKDLEGNIDIDEPTRASLDIILTGFHPPVFAPRDIDANTEAMSNVIKSGKIHVVTHPGNTRFPIHIEQIVKLAAQQNVALEINNSSFLYSRKGCFDNCQKIAQLAKKYDAPISVGSDAHNAWDLGRFDKAKALITDVGYPAERVINNTVESVFAYLATKGIDIAHEFDW
ncbi:phosphatase [Vibrio sp. UCD-FRSSP16_10]|uniref:phosphatase n=1 Tax=unclassified Vibrio TaxID=2614977 RepID=UPI000800C955|nr:MULTISPECIES: phosphatase [unclassified Vibrio]OBT16308.1 phosphatase [Vibrio sp. UCD-FRSSP16_30]OBT21173.1 phosphatase [Vibrio sp. UCD-FRSSP16_10]